MTDLARLSATETALAIRERRVSATEVMQAAIKRIEAADPKLNAFVFTAFDEALGEAKKADQAVARGDALGPLHGVPTAMKDLFDFKPGWPSTLGGIPQLKENIADMKCGFVESMEAAGAIFVGKTNSPAMGYRGTTDNAAFGPTGNPFDPTRNAGGSSGGSAAAVASGMLAVAEGTDGGGSIRIPAAWTNTVGYRPYWYGPMLLPIHCPISLKAPLLALLRMPLSALGFCRVHIRAIQTATTWSMTSRMPAYAELRG